jgi:putative flavoprotein involved in K+ transport
MSINHEVVVVGGGQAGLAIGHHLARAGVRFTILEAAAEPAAAWRSRWDSLRLFTPARHDGLPGLPFPGAPDHYPTRDEVVAYLSDYARRFELPVQLNSRVDALHREPDGSFRVELADRTLYSDQVVVATGPFQAPRIPALAQQLTSDVVQLHSSEYRRPTDLPGGRVLIVGGGNTGFQIAAELAPTHGVHLAIGARQAPLPQRLLGRDLFDFLSATGLLRVTVDSRLGRRMHHRETLIGSSPRRARRAGITLHPRATQAAGSTVTFADGCGVDVQSVLWATGYTREHSWIHAPVFGPDGAIEHRRGVTTAPGLYLLGMPWQHTRGSALLGWVGDDAEYLAAHIGAVAARRPRSLTATAAYFCPGAA